VLADAVGVADPAAALAEGSGLPLEREDAFQSPPPGALITRLEIQQLVGSPDRWHHGRIHDLRLGDLLDQALDQVFLVGRGLTQSPARQHPLPGWRRGKEEDQPVYAFLGMGRCGQRSLGGTRLALGYSNTEITSCREWSRCRAGGLCS
jgi:hypothetical protein